MKFACGLALQADSPRLSPGAGVAVLVFLQQRSVPGAGSCRGSERAGPPPEHRPHAQHRSSQPSLHQGCRRGPGHPLCRLAPTTQEEAGWGAGRQVEQGVPGSACGGSCDPSVVTLVPPDYLSALRLQVHPPPVPLDPTFSCLEIPEPSVWAAGGGGHFGTPPGSSHTAGLPGGGVAV